MAVEGRTHKPVIDHSLCGSCSVCMEACPAEVMPDMRQTPDSMRAKIYGNSDMDVHFKEDDHVMQPKCQGSCPISQDIRGYIRLVMQKKYKEALELIRRTNPLPSVCGYVCHHPCESACVRTDLDETLSIRSLKQFIADTAYGEVSPNQPVDRKNRKVAIIGSGPAGLAAGYELSRMGWNVDIIESYHRPGGLLAWGIPDFRLPRDILERDIEYIRGTGVHIRTNTVFGRDITLADLDKEGFDAVIVAVGTQKGLTLGFKNENTTAGYLECLDFLKRRADREPVSLGREVVVVGGGNAAMDAARSANKENGTRVTLVYRRGPDEMPADRQEVLDAMAEGVDIRYFTMPLNFVTKDGRITALACARTELAQADDGGRPSPVQIKDSQFLIPADTIISAIGQKADHKALENAWGAETVNLAPDPDTLATNIPKVFAAGDFATGASTIVEAMACGKKAAIKVDEYLSALG